MPQIDIPSRLSVACYMNMPTPQQEHFYRELAKLCDLTVVYSGGVSADRQILGWDVVPAGYTYLFERDHSNKCSHAHADLVFLSGLPGRLQNVLRVAAAQTRHRIAVQSEMRMPSMQTMRRKVQTRLYAAFLRTKKVPFFAIGPAMRNYCLELGIDEALIFPFAYFSASDQIRWGRWDGPIVFIGSLSHRKGVDVLLRAFAISNSQDARRLVLVGDGEEKNHLVHLASEMGLKNRVTFEGVVPNSSVESIIQEASVLVLPSRFDGWGFVVNEALSVGVPAIVSDRCGVAEVVLQKGGGVVFRADNVTALAQALDTILESENSWRRFADAAFQAHEAISAEAGAKYFLSVVEYISSGFSIQRPRAPWLAHVAATGLDGS